MSVLAGTRTLDPLIKSQLLYQLSYQDINHSRICVSATCIGLGPGGVGVFRTWTLPLLQHFKSLFFLFGAENETRTRDPDLGKVVLYQLSYFRVTLNALSPFTSHLFFGTPGGT